MRSLQACRSFFTLVTSAGLFFGILLLLELGRRLGLHHLVHHPEAIGKTHQTLETTVFGLMGLLLAFTFSGSVTRYTEWLDLVNQEALAIDTVYLRLELLSDAALPPLKALVREFTDERIAAHRTQGDSHESLRHLEKANELHKALLIGRGAGSIKSVRLSGYQLCIMLKIV